MSTCHDGRVVYVSMTSTLLQDCTLGLLITLHAVTSHIHPYPQSDAQTLEETLLKSSLFPNI